MKCYIILPAIFLFISCSTGGAARRTEKTAADNAIIEKNKQTAILNKVAESIQTIQKLEKQGRDMEAVRQAPDAESRRQCGAAMEDRQQKAKDLESEINEFPSLFKTYLSPVVADLNDCVSCSKTAMASCIKTRAALNKAIAEIYRK